MAEEKVINDYFYDEAAYDYHDGGYVPLEEPQTPQQPLNIPGLLKPDKETATDMYYTIVAQTGEVQLLPGKKTKTWGYNGPLLGKTVVFKRGKTIHVHLVNHLPEVTTFHWHGLAIPGPIEDGGCHALSTLVRVGTSPSRLTSRPPLSGSTPTRVRQRRSRFGTAWPGAPSSRTIMRPACPCHATTGSMTFRSSSKTGVSTKITSGTTGPITIRMGLRARRQ